MLNSDYDQKDSSSYFSPYEINQGKTIAIERAFRQLDIGNIGTLSKQQLRSMIMYSGEQYNKSIVREEIQKCGETITIEDFSRIFKRAEAKSVQEQSKWIFSMYDKSTQDQYLDHKGYIDRDDLQRASEITGIDLSKEELDNMLGNSVDKQVLFDEFMHIMAKQLDYF